MAHVPERKEDMSSYTEGQVHQFMNSLEASGFTSGDLTKIGQSEEKRLQILGIARGELVTKTIESVWKTWKTVKLGTLKNVGEIRKALKAGGHVISDWANDILSKPAFKVSVAEQDVELVNVSVEELGFKDGTRYADICKRALELGLDLCPAEVGPQLCLQFKDQLKGTYVVVAMEAITDSVGRLHVFHVERSDDGGQYLYAHYGYAGSVWDAYDRFVFLRRKTSQTPVPQVS